MDLPEARKIARHHLGDRLHWIGRGGPHADLWIVQAWPDKGHMLSAQGATVDAAAADCASQLRATGWTPTHARLEWERDGDEWQLCLRIDQFVSLLWIYCDGEQPGPLLTEWHAANMPELPLPPFQETPDAS